MTTWNLSETIAGFTGAARRQPSADKCRLAEALKSGLECFDLQNIWMIFRWCINSSLNGVWQQWWHRPCRIHEMFINVNIQTLKNSQFPTTKLMDWSGNEKHQAWPPNEVIEWSCDHSGTVFILPIGNLIRSRFGWPKKGSLKYCYLSILQASNRLNT